jgi:hypothetical protein
MGCVQLFQPGGNELYLRPANWLLRKVGKSPWVARVG